MMDWHLILTQMIENSIGNLLLGAIGTIVVLRIKNLTVKVDSRLDQLLAATHADGVNEGLRQKETGS
jgi:hypothetical protein